MTPKILVVDDDAALAEMLTIVLRGEGFETDVVGDGVNAMDTFRSVQPDLVLLDLMLPGKSGIDVCKEIRVESRVPIVMLTAKTDTVAHRDHHFAFVVDLAEAKLNAVGLRLLAGFALRPEEKRDERGHKEEKLFHLVCYVYKLRRKNTAFPRIVPAFPYKLFR